MTNLVHFPKERLSRLPQTEEEMYSKILNIKVDFINEAVDLYGRQLLSYIANDGFEIEDETFCRDFAFALESIRSSLYRSAGARHPLQPSIDECMKAMDDFYGIRKYEEEDD